MNTPTIAPAAQTSRSKVSPSAQALAKLVTFQIGTLTLALPIAAVYKVVNLAPIHGSGLHPVGVTAIGDHNYTVIDLHQQIFQTRATLAPSASGYLILVQLATGELLGIPVTEAPSLIEVPLSLVRILPASYRRSDTLAIASHIVMLSDGETDQTIFVLDVNSLISEI